MSSYASNVPVSRPISTGHVADADLGGLQWSDAVGFIFSPRANEILPIRTPPITRPAPPRPLRGDM